MNRESYGTDHDEEAQLAPSTVNQIAVETNALAVKRKRERLVFGLTALLTTAVVIGVALHSSSGSNAIAQTTLSQTAARVSSLRSANFGIAEGKAIKCSEDDPNLYRMTNNERRPYPSTEIAAAWDPNWQDFFVADCTDIPIGEDMSIPSESSDAAPADDEYSPTDPTETPTTDPFDELPKETENTDGIQPEVTDPNTPNAAEPETSSATEPEASEPSNPDATEPGTSGVTEPETLEPSNPEPKFSEPRNPEPEMSEPRNPDYIKPESFDKPQPERFEPIQPGDGERGVPGPEVDAPNLWWKAPESNPAPLEETKPWIDEPKPKANITDSWWKAPSEQQPQAPGPKPQEPQRPGANGWSPNYGPQENLLRGSNW